MSVFDGEPPHTPAIPNPLPPLSSIMYITFPGA